MTFWERLHAEPCPHGTTGTVSDSKGYPIPEHQPCCQYDCETCFEAAVREELESAMLAAADRLERPYMAAGAWFPKKEDADKAAAYALRLQAAAIREARKP